MGDFNPRSPQGERPVTQIVRELNKDFNPRSPQGERLMPRLLIQLCQLFQSTLPARGATASGSMLVGDVLEFQSTLPARGATPLDDQLSLF